MFSKIPLSDVFVERDTEVEVSKCVNYLILHVMFSHIHAMHMFKIDQKSTCVKMHHNNQIQFIIRS